MDEPPSPVARPLLVSRAWVQLTVLVLAAGFFVLGFLAYRTHVASPPIPQAAIDPEGRVVYTGEDIRAGQAVFLRNGLMAYGSVLGHGAYLGPDYTADYLRRAADIVIEQHGGTAAAADVAARELQENRYDPETRLLALTAAEVVAFGRVRDQEVPRFRGGLARTLVVLALFIIAAAAARARGEPRGVAALGAAAVLSGAVGLVVFRSR